MKGYNGKCFKLKLIECIQLYYFLGEYAYNNIQDLKFCLYSHLYTYNVNFSVSSG